MSGESPMVTVGEISHKPFNHLQEKQTKNCPHHILTKSDQQIHFDTNNSGICKR